MVSIPKSYQNGNGSDPNGKAPRNGAKPDKQTQPGRWFKTPTELPGSDLSDKAYRLYGVIASHADNKTGVCAVSRKTLMGKLRCTSTATFHRALNELVSG